MRGLVLFALIGIVSLGLFGFSSAHALSEDVRIVINEVHALDSFETFIEGSADFYPRVTIEGQEFTKGTEDGENDISPNWIFSKSVGTTNPIPIIIRIFDEDVVSSDDQADLKPTTGRDLFLNLDLNTCSVSGDVTGNCDVPLVSQGSDDDSARIVFTISALVDMDNDGHYSTATGGGDCNDSNLSVYPGAIETVADGIDQDCDSLELCYADTDADGFGSTSRIFSSNLECNDLGESTVFNDCNDDESAAFPGNPEVADGIDNDCDGAIDEGLAPELIYDFGDAPDPLYSTLLASDGPRHAVPENPSITLGFIVDAETDAFANTLADGDDTNIVPGPGPLFDDEDGVIFTSGIHPGMMAHYQIIVSPDGFVDTWIDFNGDGDFLDLSEQIKTSFDYPGSGVQAESFLVPSDAVLGDTISRFRISSTGNLAPTGPASDGEVEDYLITISEFQEEDADGDGIPDDLDTIDNASCGTGTISDNDLGQCVSIPSLVCLPGQFDNGGACSACNVGTYQSASGQLQCLQSEPGHFVDTSGATSQSECPADTFTPTSGSILCDVCPVGEIPNSSQTACEVDPTLALNQQVIDLQGIITGLESIIDDLENSLITGPGDTINSLILQIQTLVDGDMLDKKDSKKVLKDLDRALKDLKKGNEKACKDVSKFVKDANKLVEKGDLDETKAQPLLDDANALLAECPVKDKKDKNK